MDASYEARILLITELAADGMAMNDAALASDWDEARFRALLIGAKAEEASLNAIIRAARYVQAALGPTGPVPSRNYGKAMLDLANVIGFELEQVAHIPFG